MTRHPQPTSVDQISSGFPNFPYATLCRIGRTRLLRTEFPRCQITLPVAGRVPPLPEERAARYRAAGYWTGRTVDSLLRRAAATWPDRVAVVDTVTSHTYRELDELVRRTAGGFAALGIAPTDRVLLQLPNSCRFAVALFGLLRAGAIPVLCLPGHRLAELTASRRSAARSDWSSRMDRAGSTTARWHSSWWRCTRS